MTTQVSLVDDVSKVCLTNFLHITNIFYFLGTIEARCHIHNAPQRMHTSSHARHGSDRKFLLCTHYAILHPLQELGNCQCRSQETHLVEEDFPLKNAVGEGKYNVNLARALHLLKKNSFQEHTFYVTPCISIDTKLLRNIVNAYGGQVCHYSSHPPKSAYSLLQFR